MRRRLRIVHAYIPYMIVIDDFVYVRSSLGSILVPAWCLFIFIFCFFLSVRSSLFCFFSLLMFLVLCCVCVYLYDFFSLLCLLLSSPNIFQHRTPVTYSHDIFVLRSHMNGNCKHFVYYCIVSYLDRIPVDTVYVNIFRHRHNNHNNSNNKNGSHFDKMLSITD